jgi:putative tributyrin esterase
VAAASLFGATDIHSLWTENARFKKDLHNIFGNQKEFINSEEDLFKLSRDLKKSGINIPALFQCCGTGDFLYKDNIRFRDHLRKLNYDLHYQESPATHSWDFWDVNIQDVLSWLP